jgi:hypothetical protein
MASDNACAEYQIFIFSWKKYLRRMQLAGLGWCADSPLQ